eukprot:COSAG05_NODE_6407_length_963_cov_1270.521991_1_plen_32_part_10
MAQHVAKRGRTRQGVGEEPAGDGLLGGDGVGG